MGWAKFGELLVLGLEMGFMGKVGVGGAAVAERGREVCVCVCACVSEPLKLCLSSRNREKSSVYLTNFPRVIDQVSHVLMTNEQKLPFFEDSGFIFF